MNNLLSNERKFLIIIYWAYFFIVTFITSTAPAWAPVTEVQKMFLKQFGYSTDTPEQLIEATKSDSYAVRFMALNLLTELVREKAIPVLKNALNDPEEVTVRWTAAHLLGTLGDKSGLKQMRADFEKLKAELAIPFPDDPNMTPDDRERIENRKNIALHDALDVAKVLAELDDRRGYELAVKAAFEGTWDLHRDKAIYVLVEIAKTKKSILIREKRDPVSILCRMAESEKSTNVFNTLVFSAEKLPYDETVLILEKAKESKNQTPEKRSETQDFLNWLKAKKKADEIKFKETK